MSGEGLRKTTLGGFPALAIGGRNDRPPLLFIHGAFVTHEPFAPWMEFLAGHRGFIDLDEAAYEWRYFFHQFELYRLQLQTGARYLLPITLGTSLRGLLLLPDREQPLLPGDESVAESVNTVGLEAVRR